MSKRIFTNEETDQLSKNKNVVRCSERSITYAKEFKIRAVMRYEQGMTPQDIFREAGFDLNVIGRKTPKHCLADWKNIFRQKGARGLAETRGRHGGRKPKPKDASDRDKIKRLETENAYLKAENAFLAHLRSAKKTE
jgi:transposase